MAEFKYTAALGATDRGEIAVAAGDAEAQSDTISINIDVTNASRGDVLNVIETLKYKILSEPWPPIS